MRKLVFSMLMLCAQWSMAQTFQQINEEILKYEQCFEQLSHPEPKSVSHQLKDGTSVEVIQRTDYRNKRFLQADPDVRQLNVNIMDNQDLTNWEMQEASKIFDDAFGVGPAFNIYAHGICDPEGNSSGVRLNGKDLTPAQTAELILRTLDDYELVLNAYNRPFPIVLHTCTSAKGSNPFAAQLQREISKHIKNAVVVAADAPVYAQIDSKGIYLETISNPPLKANAIGRKWIAFDSNGARQTSPDWKETVRTLTSPWSTM